MHTEIKILHIHTDDKFVKNSQMFHGTYFTNTTVKIHSTNTYSERMKNILYFSDTQGDIDEIVDLGSKVDCVVLYNLDLVKSKIALKLPEEIKVIWRFFGVELYSRRQFEFISKKGRREGYTLKEKLKHVLKQNSLLKKINDQLVHKEDYEEIFSKAIRRVDLMLVLSKEEYAFLKQKWPILPPFVKLPHFHFSRKLLEFNFEEDKNLDKPIIVLGNSRSSYNNHIDLIDLIEKYSTKNNFDFSLLFNYGTQGYYFEKVVDRVSEKPYFRLIENFMTKEEYVEFFSRTSAVVLNGYRQMAGAAIRMAFETGAKVYINEINMHKEFLENEGFRIFSIADFENDLKQNNLGFDRKIALYNYNNFEKFKNRYTVVDFQERILQEF